MVLLLNPLGETFCSVLCTSNKINMQNSKIDAASIPWNKINCHLSLWSNNQSSVPVFNMTLLYHWLEWHLRCYLTKFPYGMFLSFESLSMVVPVRFLWAETYFTVSLNCRFSFTFQKSLRFVDLGANFPKRLSSILSSFATTRKILKRRYFLLMTGRGFIKLNRHLESLKQNYNEQYNHTPRLRYWIT